MSDLKNLSSSAIVPGLYSDDYPLAFTRRSLVKIAPTGEVVHQFPIDFSFFSWRFYKRCNFRLVANSSSLLFNRTGFFLADFRLGRLELLSTFPSGVKCLRALYVDDSILFGDYASYPTSGFSNIFRLCLSSGTIKVVYSVARVKHIHSISYLPRFGVYAVCCGDSDSESHILFLSQDFKFVASSKRSQDYRVIDLVDSGASRIYLPTDKESGDNALMAIDLLAKNNQFEIIDSCIIPGLPTPIFQSCPTSSGILCAECVEPHLREKPNSIRLFVLDPQNLRCSVVAHSTYSSNPLLSRAFQYPQYQFALYNPRSPEDQERDLYCYYTLHDALTVPSLRIVRLPRTA